MTARRLIHRGVPKPFCLLYERGKRKTNGEKNKDLIGGYINHALLCVCVCEDLYGCVIIFGVLFFLSDICVGLFFPLTRCCVFPRVLSILPDVS